MDENGSFLFFFILTEFFEKSKLPRSGILMTIQLTIFVDTLLIRREYNIKHKSVFRKQD